MDREIGNQDSQLNIQLYDQRNLWIKETDVPETAIKSLKPTHKGLGNKIHYNWLELVVLRADRFTSRLSTVVKLL